MKNLMCLISLVLMFGMHTTAQSQIEIFGLSWGIEDVKGKVESMGYTCTPNIIYEESQDCVNGEKEIEIAYFWSDGELVFNCHVWNGCNFSLKEVAQAIVNTGIVPSMEYEVRYLATGTQKIYCGRGDDGDKLCVTSDALVGLRVRLLKGNFGSGGMSFN